MAGFSHLFFKEAHILIRLKYILLFLSNLSAIPAIWIGRREKSSLWFYALASLLFDINGYVLNALHIERLWASNLFFLIEFVLVSAYFIRNVIPPKAQRVTGVLSLLVALCFIFNTWNRNIMLPNYIGAAILCSFYIFYSMLGLYKVITEIEFVLVERNPLFIFCVAFLLYASGTFIIFLFEHKLWHFQDQFLESIWRLIRNPLNTIKNLLLAYGFWLIRKTK